MTLNLSTLYGSVGPANSDIAAAVAAPSASTIATAVAGAVPTISAINTSVSTYASGFGNTYTLLTNTAWNGSTSYTVSWSGTYKRILIMSMGPLNGAATAQLLQMRLNGDSNTNYNFSFASGTAQTTNVPGTYIPLPNLGANVTNFFNVTIENPNSTGPKLLTGQGFGSQVNYSYFGYGQYTGTSAVTSATIFTGSAALNSAGLTNYNGIYVYGVN